MKFHNRDLFYLRSYGADLESEPLKSRYTKLRKRWEFSNSLGGMPTVALITLAADYPDLEKFPDEKEVVVEEEEKPETPKPTPTKKKPATKKKQAA